MENDHDIECCCNECMAGPAPKRPTPINHTPAQGTGTTEVEPAGYNSRTGERWRWAKKQYHDPEEGHEWSEIADEMRQLSAKLEGELTALTAALSSHAEWQPIETAPKDGSQRIIIAQFRGNELVDIDFDAVFEKESESWEMPQEYWVWKSAFGRVEEPTHWTPLPALRP